MNRLAVGALAEIAGATGSIAIAAVAVYVGIRQWVDGKRISREQRELTEEIERKSEAAKLEQDRIIRAQSLDSYFDGISTLLLRGRGRYLHRYRPKPHQRAHRRHLEDPQG